jgi:hypothetical protein
MKSLFIAGAGAARQIDPAKIMRQPQKKEPVPGSLQPGNQTQTQGEKK